MYLQDIMTPLRKGDVVVTRSNDARYVIVSGPVAQPHSPPEYSLQTVQEVNNWRANMVEYITGGEEITKNARNLDLVNRQEYRERDHVLYQMDGVYVPGCVVSGEPRTGRRDMEWEVTHPEFGPLWVEHTEMNPAAVIPQGEVVMFGEADVQILHGPYRDGRGVSTYLVRYTKFIQEENPDRGWWDHTGETVQISEEELYTSNFYFG